MRYLREKIETVPAKPQLLVNETKVGYLLKIEPVVGKNSIPSENGGLPSHFPESSAS
jgi:hypothetical protein